MQMTQKNYCKWSNYEIKVDENLLNNIKNFVPVDGEKKIILKLIDSQKMGGQLEYLTKKITKIWKITFKIKFI